ncbi:uncharacterized protein ARMOST_04260 [Armillaria ostoyae]|uniref:Uncharacterized protein n=1 Tax=Armillaria ostoyae TaxID=47428 RepID=A0A284QWW8_ARMOS|nr:uncharacterized protein ARMOST_04260 [Armillaria ostoyae]
MSEDAPNDSPLQPPFVQSDSLLPRVADMVIVDKRPNTRHQNPTQPLLRIQDHTSDHPSHPPCDQGRESGVQDGTCAT